MNLAWSGQTDNSRLVLIKRAQAYHTDRVHMQTIYRRRSELDDKLINEVIELAISPYLRVRRYVTQMIGER